MIAAIMERQDQWARDKLATRKAGKRSRWIIYPFFLGGGRGNRTTGWCLFTNPIPVEPPGMAAWTKRRRGTDDAPEQEEQQSPDHL